MGSTAASRGRRGQCGWLCHLGTITPFPCPTGTLASICGALVMLLPETKGIALPETVDDVEKLSRYDTKFSTP